MGFSHYPKTSGSTLVAWRLPRPPRGSTFLESTINFDDVNQAREPLLPGETWTAWSDIMGFTRIFGTIVAPVPLTITLDMSDEEVSDDGEPINDKTLPFLSYSLPVRVHQYDPSSYDRRKATGRFFEIGHARFLRVMVTNTADSPLARCSIVVRGSVF